MRPSIVAGLSVTRGACYILRACESELSFSSWPSSRPSRPEQALAAHRTAAPPAGDLRRHRAGNVHRRGALDLARRPTSACCGARGTETDRRVVVVLVARRTRRRGRPRRHRPPHRATSPGPRCATRATSRPTSCRPTRRQDWLRSRDSATTRSRPEGAPRSRSSQTARARRSSRSRRPELAVSPDAAVHGRAARRPAPRARPARARRAGSASSARRIADPVAVGSAVHAVRGRTTPQLNCMHVGQAVRRLPRRTTSASIVLTWSGTLRSHAQALEVALREGQTLAAHGADRGRDACGSPRESPSYDDRDA